MKTNFLTITKNILKSTLVVCLAITVANCSKDDDEKPSVNPFQGYLTASGFNQQTVDVINSADYEFGYSFIPSVNGKIKAIVAKIPDAHLGMRVTIWNADTQAILRTETIDVATADVEVTKNINALSLVKDQEYFVTFNSNDWYDHRKTGGGNVTYPFVVGDIAITSYGYANGTAQTFPTTFPLGYNAGDISFKFQKN